MKRKYSSPVMEVEVFEASEYVAACYRCYAPTRGWKPISESEQQSRELYLSDLYLETNRVPGLQIGSDQKVNSNLVCTSGTVVSNNELKQGYLVDKLENLYNDVSVLEEGGKYHIVKHDAPNHS